MNPNICVCGFSRRGLNHEKGEHHKGRMSKQKTHRAALRAYFHEMKRNVGDPGDHEKTCNCFACKHRP